MVRERVTGNRMPLQGCAIIAGLLMLVGTPSFAQGYDLVIANGRVMDPETGFDAVANVGINNGYVTKITTAKTKGKRTIDATGHVVAPGFIDYHTHGQDDFAYRLY